MKLEPYRRFSYCEDSGKYVAFEVTYVLFHFQCVFLLESVLIPLYATGPCEQQGWGFWLNASSPCAMSPDGRCVPLFRDRGQRLSLVGGETPSVANDQRQTGYYQ